MYEPWKDSYLNYSKLKNLLYEGQSGEEWGERNESRFVEELDSELEKVGIIWPIEADGRSMPFNMISASNWRRRLATWRMKLKGIPGRTLWILV
jgi:hypothetical protein